MKLLRPFTITPGNLTSNVALDDAPEYSASASYGVGDTVMSTAGVAPTYRRYESLAASNVGNALDDASKWLDLGPVNRWAMFDTKNGTATVNAGGINTTVSVNSRVDGLALFGLTATSVRVIMTAGAYGTVYDKTYSLRSDSGVTSWYAYFTEEIVFDSELVLTDLPLYGNPNVTVQISNDSGATSCGTFVLGQTRDLGDTTYGAKGGIQDYSRKETDDFGNYTLVERAFAKRNTYRIVCENNVVDALFNLLAEVRATPVVWLGSDDYAMTWTYGWARDWAVEISYPTKSFLTIEIEGLT
ncbi:hypothetical protein ACQKOE_13785 [Novosphingobium sp. NPDC080210]|uniref:hypothetical protein n=1 Tax=Novosphingobium sp. NPDC080210 TaxID=3390596 RepID=UPI003CFDF13B